MKLLSIGNSFSQDAQKWLYDVCKSAGKDIYNVNLYYGGCSIHQHWNFYVNNQAEYDYEIMAEPDRKITLVDALATDDWDVITIQQASHDSGKYESYQPYLNDLIKVVREACPNAKILMHKTWAYEIDSPHPCFIHYNNDQQYMYNRLCEAYQKGADDINAEIIPSGDVIQYMRDNVPEFDYKNGGLSLNRDGFHLSLGYGRYAAALTWYCKLFGGNANDVTFVPDICEDEHLVNVVKSAVNTIMCK